MSEAVAGLGSEKISLHVSRDGHVATVTLLGPGKGNALGPDFWRELPEVFTALDADEAVRAVVLTGSGSHFSYGLDLHAMVPAWSEVLGDRSLAKPRDDFLRDVRRMQQGVSRIAECRKPVIAAISGWCIGGGVDVIAAADIRLASADAAFSVREARMAIVADLGSLQRLSGIIGEGQLRQLAFTGEDIGADRARDIGLVVDVYDNQQAVLGAATKLAERIAANPPLAVQGAKDVLGAVREQQVAAGLRYVSAWNAAFLPSEDLREATNAFAERRSPHFTGQ
jgi:enoyl-CoA hydratase